MKMPAKPGRTARPVHALGLLLLGPILGPAPLGLAIPPQESGAGTASEERVDDVRTVLEKIVETRRLLSKERRDWVLGREMLNERIGVVRGETDGLRTKLTSVQESTAEADRKRAELLAEKDTRMQSTHSLVEVVGALETRVRGLLPRLPDPLQARIELLVQRLPADPANTEKGLSERFQNLIGILDQVDKFNRDITVASEVRTLPGGTRAEVTAIYFGIGQGYYVTADGAAAGIGAGGPEGWTWRAADDAAEAITHAIAIWRNEKGAEFVPLPLRID